MDIQNKEGNAIGPEKQSPIDTKQMNINNNNKNTQQHQFLQRLYWIAVTACSIVTLIISVCDFVSRVMHTPTLVKPDSFVDRPLNAGQARTTAQPRISITLKDATLEKVFTEIEKRSGFAVFYNAEVLRTAGTVSIDIKDAGIEEVMQRCLQGLPLEFTVQEKTIFVKKEARKPSAEGHGGTGSTGPAMKAVKNQLDETVVKGYYNTTNRLNTGDVTTVKSEDIMGQNSIDNGNDPLYIVDGVPFSAQTLSSSYMTGGALGQPGQYSKIDGAGLSPFNAINPADIEYIEVLKDADATTICNSRIVNGAVLITTKYRKAGNPWIRCVRRHRCSYGPPQHQINPENEYTWTNEHNGCTTQINFWIKNG